MRGTFIQDFDFVVDTIDKTHPRAAERLPDQYTESIKTLRENISDKFTLINSLSKLTASLTDAHTNIELPLTENDLALNIPADWRGNELYVTSDYCGLKRGDRIISINGEQITAYLNSLAQYIPHENTYLLKIRTTQYPYANYYLFSALNLGNKFGKDATDFKIKFARNNKLSEIKFNLRKYNGCCNFRENNFLSLNYINNTAFIKISECKYSQEYIDTLVSYFSDISDRKIGTLVLDLSENMGGNSAVTQEFIRHINVQNYRFYEIYVRESEKLKRISSREHLIHNDTYKENIFSGKLFCYISNTTFSSAKFFATVLQDNNIAELVGENSGGKPTSYGAPKRFTTPNYNIRFRVSTRIFKRPNARKDDDLSLIPDIFLNSSFQTNDKKQEYTELERLLNNR